MDELEEIRQKLRDFLVERDWNQFHNARDLAISISLESAELLEVFQWKDHMSSAEIVKDEKLLAKIKEELADVFIYCINLANKLDIDIYEIINNKIKRNAEKYPPTKVKGSAKKYKEYD